MLVKEFKEICCGVCGSVYNFDTGETIEEDVLFDDLDEKYDNYTVEGLYNGFNGIELAIYK